jgi:tRNA nucleotidyltransferase (CCA-adding enzyme)
MSDYMFVLESHLSADQNRVLEQVQAAAGAAGVNLFLTGGGMRDMLGGFHVRDLDFSVEGNALKLAKALEQQGARTLAVDENRHSAELVFASGVTAQVAMSRKERYAKTGAKPQVTPATIQEDLRGRDFTVNAMALSLNRASRGLLLDPTNGLADLGRREMRSTHPYVFYDDPARLLRLVRLRVRLSFTVEERTRTQFDNARAAHVANLIPPRTLLEELKRIAAEPSPSEVVQALDRDGLLALFSPALAGSKLNLTALARLEKAARLVESANLVVAPQFASFLLALTAKLSPKEKSVLFKAVEMPAAEIDRMRDLEPRGWKLEQALKSARVKRPSHVYRILTDANADEMVFLLGNSMQRVVPERIRNYLQKYLPAMQDVPPAEWGTLEGQPGTPKYHRSRQAFLASHLDVRPRKPPVPEPESIAPVDALARGRGR